MLKCGGLGGLVGERRACITQTECRTTPVHPARSLKRQCPGEPRVSWGQIFIAFSSVGKTRVAMEGRRHPNWDSAGRSRLHKACFWRNALHNIDACPFSSSEAVPNLHLTLAGRHFPERRPQSSLATPQQARTYLVSVEQPACIQPSQFDHAILYERQYAFPLRRRSCQSWWTG